MNQEITYSEKLFSFLFEDNSPYELTPQKEIWQILKQNYFVVDQKNKLLENYAKEILALPDSDRKDVLKIFIDGLINNKGNKKKELPIESKENLDITLSLFSKDKIYFIPTEREKIQEIVNVYPNLEVHNHISIRSPEPQQRLKNLPTRFDLKKKESYNIRTIISPFLRQAKEIRIDDPYLPNNYASVNFFKIIKMIRDTHTILNFLRREDYLKGSRLENAIDMAKRYDGFINKISRLNEIGYNIEIKNRLKKGHVERYIITESVQIYLPGGFDFLDKFGFVSKKYGKKELRIERISN